MKAGPPTKILFDCERMKYPYTGLYYYCLFLARNLELTNKDKEFCFYTRANTKSLFANSCTIDQHSLHKFLLPSTKGFSIWHSTYQGTMYFPWHRKIKIVFTIHDLNFLYDASKSKLKKDKLLAGIRKKVKRADHIVAISQFVLDDLRKHVSLEGKRVSVIYNGCSIEEIPDLEPAALIPEGQFLFTMGTIVDKKNFHVLPGILKDNDYKLVIAGVTNSEDYKSRIIAEAEAQGVLDRVIFTGPVSENDKQWYLKNCLAFLFPSISEGFGLPVIEAMYFGKPVFLSRYTSLPEIGGPDAYYFDSYEPEEMAAYLQQSLTHFANNNGERKMRERAGIFDWKTSAEQYHAVYNEVLGRPA